MKIILFIFLFLYCSLPNNTLNSKFSTNSKNQNYLLSLFAIEYANRNDCRSIPNSFWARDLLSSAGTSYCVSANLVASSSKVDLYVEKNLTTDLDYSQVAQAFSTILEIERETISDPSDINKDGKITVLVLDIKDGATATSGFVAGYVDPVNFFADNPAFPTRSNEREILFMDGVELLNLRRRDLSLGRPDTFLSTLAHELQHLIRYPISNGIDDTWIDEGTSEAISDITGYGPQTARINCFKGDASSSISCTGGVGAFSSNSPSLFNWRGTLKNYAFSYAFMKYLYDSSGTTDSTRKLFFKNSVKGIGNNRASNITGLMNIFMNSSNFNQGLLGTTTDSIFKRLYGNFMGQAVNFSNLNTSYLGNNNIVSLESVKNFYPLTGALTNLGAPTPFSAVSDSTSFNLSPSQVLRVNGTTSGITNGNSEFIAIQGSSSYIVLNASTSAGSSNTVNLNLGESNEKICPHEFFSNELKLIKNENKLKSLIHND
jgi:hypothetical protein